MKARFPLPVAEVKKVLDALAVPVPEMARENYTLEQFVSELGHAGRLACA
jgi:hypothetical protein